MTAKHLPGIVLGEDNWDRQPDSFTQAVEKGRLGQNAGFSNGLNRVNNYLYGTHRGRYYLIGADSGVGKCLGKGTKVIMYDGTLRNVENVRPGEQLMGPDSQPRNVLSTCQGKEQMYWVRQKRGIDYRVNESHILSLRYKPNPKWTTKILPGQSNTKKSLRKRSYQQVTIPKEDTVNISVRDYLQVPNKALYHGWKANGVDFGSKAVFEPYMIGLWLGDGTSTTTAITNVDEEVLSFLQLFAYRNGLRYGPKGVGKSSITNRFRADRKLHRIHASTGMVEEVFSSIGEAHKYGRNEYLSRATKSGKVVGGYKWQWSIFHNTFLQVLQQYNLLSNKHIPLDYIQASKEDRLALIAGLIDSDGYVNPDNNMVEITQKRKELSEQIVLVLRSLGFYTTMKEKKATMKRADGSIYSSIVYRVSFSHCTSIPCLVERKKARSANTKTLQTDITVEKDIVDNYYGFVIDGDHLFLLEDFTVTHNTTLADFMYVLSLWMDCRRKGIPYRCVYLSFEISRREKIARWISTFVKLLFDVDIPSDYIMGRIPGMIVTDDHMVMIRSARQYVDEFLKDVTVLEGGIHPTWVLNYMVEFYEKLGTVHRDKPKNAKDRGFIRGFTPHDPNLVTQLVCDHLALGHEERGVSGLKAIIDKFSTYAVVLKNTFDTIVVFLQQFATDLMSTHRMNKKGDSVLVPQRIDFGDSKYTYRDADVVFGLVSPIMFDIALYKKYDIGQLLNYFLACHLMKNRYGPASRMIPLFINPISGIFDELPQEATNELAMQPFYERVNKLEKICQSFFPRNL